MLGDHGRLLAPIDAMLARAGTPALPLSPQGVAIASTRAANGFTP